MLERIHSEREVCRSKPAFVGNETSDDAAVYDPVMAPRSSAPPISLCRLSITRSTLAHRRYQRHQRYSLWGGNRLWRLPSSAGHPHRR
ncbi:hypothetical protein J4734_17245 [Klebsiella pneumoniae]|uniref:Uncharacterized protein n=1 Tax=Klebsiella pneumoniae TaxID=573 RepID=A0A939NN61_KLEPN|nr:hypothetical protein [Klebsiella pneumoniae]